jgi:hypothetical protein
MMEPTRAADACTCREIQTGTLTQEGYTSTGTINPMSCPHFIMLREHFTPSGTSCRCNDSLHTEMKEWGYTWNGQIWT